RRAGTSPARCSTFPDERRPAAARVQRLRSGQRQTAAPVDSEGPGSRSRSSLRRSMPDSPEQISRRRLGLSFEHCRWNRSHAYGFGEFVLLFPPGVNRLNGLAYTESRLPSGVLAQLFEISHIEELISGSWPLRVELNSLSGDPL